MSVSSTKVDKVLFVTPEITPLAKSGGLGDVAAGLPPALTALGLDMRLVMPLYGHIDRQVHDVTDSGLELVVPVAGEMKPCRVWQARVGGCPVYLLG
ncbi:MAG: glycogen/starch synthase, partial [Proteobacteria bacterium]|nr:glycogen/starch synthase [Pseudomonadota bacterium]